VNRKAGRAVSLNDIVWEESTCASLPSLPRWVLEFIFQVNISLEYGPFRKLNGSNWIRLCDFSKMIFLIWTLKAVKGPFGMEYDQRVIIKFLSTEGVNVS
jgi:hypothetical protein